MIFFLDFLHQLRPMNKFLLAFNMTILSNFMSSWLGQTYLRKHSIFLFTHIPVTMGMILNFNRKMYNLFRLNEGHKVDNTHFWLERSKGKVVNLQTTNTIDKVMMSLWMSLLPITYLFTTDAYKVENVGHDLTFLVAVVYTFFISTFQMSTTCKGKYKLAIHGFIHGLVITTMGRNLPVCNGRTYFHYFGKDLLILPFPTFTMHLWAGILYMVWYGYFDFLGIQEDFNML